MPMDTRFYHAQPHPASYEDSRASGHGHSHGTRLERSSSPPSTVYVAQPGTHSNPVRPEYGTHTYPIRSGRENYANPQLPPQPVPQNGFLPSRGERFRPVDPFSRRRDTEPPPRNHLLYPVLPPTFYGIPEQIEPPPPPPPVVHPAPEPDVVQRKSRSRSRSQPKRDHSDSEEDDRVFERERRRPPGACTRCKNLKVKCEFMADTGPCRRCLNAGAECLIPRRRKTRTAASRSPSPERRRSRSRCRRSSRSHSRGRHRSRSSSRCRSRSRHRRSSSRSLRPYTPPKVSTPPIPSPPSDQVIAIPENPSVYPEPTTPQSRSSSRSRTRSSSYESRDSSKSVVCPPVPPPVQPIIIQVPPISQPTTPIVVTPPKQYKPIRPQTPQVFVPPSISIHSIPLVPNEELPYPATVKRRTPWWRRAYTFAADTVPRQLYLNMLLHLPALYYSRVTKVFTDAELCLPDIEKMFRMTDNDVLDEEVILQYKYPRELQDYDTIYLLRFKLSWEDFIDHIIYEWQAQNVISVLLLSAVLTLLQIDDIGQDPLSRATAIFSLLFALMSLLHGCVLMARFGTMKKLYKAAMWAEEAQQTTTGIFWNVWVFLSMPAVWLAWSVIAFLVTVLSYVWRSGANEQYEPLTYLHALGFRISVSSVFAIGLIYFLLVLRTLSRYGSDLDRRWHRKVDLWKHPLPSPCAVRSDSPTPSYEKHPSSRSSSYTCLVSLPYTLETFQGHFNVWDYRQEKKEEFVAAPYGLLVEAGQKDSVAGPYEALIASGKRDHMRFHEPSRLLPDPVSYMRPTSPKIAYYLDVSDPSFDPYKDIEKVHTLANCCVSAPDWTQFRLDVHHAWEGKLEIPNVPQDQLLPLKETIVGDVLRVWNTLYFAPRGLEVSAFFGVHNVLLYDKYTGIRRMLNADGTVSLESARRLSRITEYSEEEEEKRGRDRRVRDSKLASSKSSSASESPRSVLPHLPQLRQDDGVNSKMDGNDAPGPNLAIRPSTEVGAVHACIRPEIASVTIILPSPGS